MANSIKIVNGKKGLILKVNGLFINHSFNKEIRAIENKIGIPCGATEWINLQALRNFWNNYRVLILASLNTQYISVNGNLILK